MTIPNPAEEITRLEGELKKMQDNYLQAENQMKNADQVSRNCRDQIIAIQAAIDTNKKYMPKQEKVAGQPSSWAETK